jgi:23S rRNA pseudouridine1911/1915/1917 synthase
MNVADALKKKFVVLYEDDKIAAVEKPPGLTTIPAPGKEGRSLNEILAALLREAGLPYGLRPCHRLDEETSGVILFAKGKAARKAVMDLFREREIHKTYIAFVQGSPARDEGSLTRSLEGRPARTEYRVLERKKLYAVVEARPLTGRKNQIRLHFKAAGHPLVGETRFAFRRDFPLAARRLMLHAAEIAFTDPWTGEERRIASGLPEDMRRFLSKNP